MSPLLDPRELAKIADLPLVARWPFLPRLALALRHRHAPIRALALRGLAGATGHAALCALVRALDDPDARVWTQALSSLWSSAQIQPARWAHALFHQRPEVRREAVRMPAPAGTAAWRVHLRADPACADQPPSPCLGDLPAELVLALLQRGVLSEEGARQHLAALDWREIRLGDRWEGLLERFWHLPSPEGTRLFSALVLAQPDPQLHQALWVLRRRHGRWPIEAALLAALHEPGLLVDRTLGLAERRQIARTLLELDHDRLIEPARVSSLLEEIEREGRDPERVCAVLSLAKDWRYPGRRRLGMLTSEVRSDPEPWAPLFALDGQVSTRTLQQLREAVGAALPGLLAPLVYRLPARRLGFLGRQRQATVGILRSLLALEAARGPAQTATVSRELVRGLPEDDLPAALAIWLDQPHPEQLRLGVALFHRLRIARTPKLASAIADLGRQRRERLMLALQWHPPADTTGLSEIESALRSGASLRAQVCTLRPAPSRWPRPHRTAVHSLTLPEATRLARAPDLEELDLLEPALAGPSLGLTTALARREGRHHLGAALALLGCHDPAPAVHRELQRFLHSEPELARAAAAHWRGWLTLPALGHAWLSDDPVHADRLGRALLADPRGLRHALAELISLPLLAERTRTGLARALSQWERHDPATFARASEPEVLEMLALPPAVAPVQPRSLEGQLPMDEIVRAALMAGGHVVREASLLPLVEAAPIGERLRARELLLRDGLDEAVGGKLAEELGPEPERSRLRSQLAGVMAWGIRTGLRLAGRRFTFHLLGDSALGYTRLDTDDIWVSPLGLLRGERAGRERLEGLILHELGHHLYHAGPEARLVWAEASRLGLHSLFNLVADEHLERRLRALDAGYGHRLKKLAAHAFQHGDREIEVGELLASLGPERVRALWSCRLAVARDPGRVSVQSGKLLAALARQGCALGRFVRALRLGRGGRDGDERVNTALALFGRDFKALDMRGLLAVTRQLAALFGTECETARLFGGHEGTGSCRGASRACRGLTDGDLRDELQQRGVAPTAPGLPNLGPAAPVETRLQLVQLPVDPAAHRALVAPIASEAARLREVLERMGQREAPAPPRAAGRRLERSRLAALAGWGEPRVMRATQRELVAPELFLGAALDCSGSMAGHRHALARAFGVLLAEAARGLPRVDVALFGFTDRKIFEAGTADRCAVASLPCEDGNDDAAALAYVAEVGRRSRRQTRLLVMVSDGLPAQCSVETLRQQVQSLTREGFLAVHVAVAPLWEICFPHHLVIEGSDLLSAVGRFGATIARLIAQEE